MALFVPMKDVREKKLEETNKKFQATLMDPRADALCQIDHRAVHRAGRRV